MEDKTIEERIIRLERENEELWKENKCLKEFIRNTIGPALMSKTIIKDEEH